MVQSLSGSNRCFADLTKADSNRRLHKRAARVSDLRVDIGEVCLLVSSPTAQLIMVGRACAAYLAA